MKPKVVVAMSGGVDSSVAAALLKEQGYEVIGMMLRLWTEPGRESANRCCTPEAMTSARRIAAQLEIPFYAVDARETFEREIVQYFIQEYTRGATPNPCVRCNRHIRWELLLNRALALGADFMATGHYARLDRTTNGHVRVFRAADHAKDQSYVLHALTPEQLAHALFPIGDFTKPEVRRIAERYNFPVAQAKDSQDLCFLAGTNYVDFLQRNSSIPPAPGPILDANGRQVGVHDGLPNYTIGQRRRLGVSSAVPLYVIDKNAVTNELVVGPIESLGFSSFTAGEMNWLQHPERESFQAHVKTRYTSQLTQCQVSLLDGGRIAVKTSEPIRDLTPGQAAVLYCEDELIGGGTIESERLVASPLRPVSLLEQS